jgi:hypothetical protein
MSSIKGKQASQGHFNGSISLNVKPEQHRMLYKEASSKNISISHLIRNIIENRSYINKRCVWTSDEFVKRPSYTIIFFTNNINTDEVCVHLYGEHQEHEDISDMDHKFSNFIVEHLEFKEQKIISCEFKEDENGEKKLHLAEIHLR